MGTTGLAAQALGAARARPADDAAAGLLLVLARAVLLAAGLGLAVLAAGREMLGGSGGVA